MNNKIVLIDLPNFYSNLLNTGIADKRDLRDYFLYWLDFDILSRSFAESPMGIWVFYSGQKFGPSDQRITGKYLDTYIARINRLRGVTAYDVNIPGEQREAAMFTCKKCHEENEAEWKSEKGIDTSLIVHLFDSLESWDAAYLLSGDADFAPAVSALRRKGKIIIGAGFQNVSSALIRECYDYINIGDTFIANDFAAYALFRPGGLVERWLTNDVQRMANELSYDHMDKKTMNSSKKAVLSVRIEYSSATGAVKAIIFMAKGLNADFSERRNEAEAFFKRTPLGEFHVQSLQIFTGKHPPVPEGVEISVYPSNYLLIDKMKQYPFVDTIIGEGWPDIQKETYVSGEGLLSLRFETCCVYDENTNGYRFNRGDK